MRNRGSAAGSGIAAAGVGVLTVSVVAPRCAGLPTKLTRFKNRVLSDSALKLGSAKLKETGPDWPQKFSTHSPKRAPSTNSLMPLFGLDAMSVLPNVPDTNAESIVSVSGIVRLKTPTLRVEPI